MTPKLTFMQYCPCCGKELHISIQESGGESAATLSYPQKNVSKEFLETHGIEFGSMYEPRHKTIFNSGIARRLIQLGNRVVDIKPQKENLDKSAFVFVVDEKFVADLIKFNK